VVFDCNGEVHDETGAVFCESYELASAARSLAGFLELFDASDELST